MSETASLSYSMRPDIAQRRIEAFRKRFREFEGVHLYLAYHAAFPLALTPDLLYRLRANFPRDVHNEELNIPWIAVADLLLSSLCTEVGYELYEMDVAVRAELLRKLRDHPRFGPQRINDLSNFMLKYVRQQLDSYDPAIRKFAQAQEWTALAATRPEEAAHSIALTLSALDADDRAKFARMASLLESFFIPSDGFTQLLTYVRGMEYYASGNEENARVELSKLNEQNQSIEVLGVGLPLPKDFHKKTWEEREEKHIYRRNFFISYHKADRAWAEWIAWQLEEVGYSILLQAWDFRSSINFEAEMNKAAKAAERIIVIFSYEYLKELSAFPERTFSLLQLPAEEVIPIRVDDCDPDSTLGPTAYFDIANLNESEASKEIFLSIHTDYQEAINFSGFSSETHRTVVERPQFPRVLYPSQVLYPSSDLYPSSESTKPITIFYCYAHEDKELRDELEKRLLNNLELKDHITHWHDQKVNIGQNWEHEITVHLNKAQFILLLISPDFVASDYCWGIEMKRALERHKMGEARVIPIILRPVDWSSLPFNNLQVLPKGGIPVTMWRSLDEAYSNIAQGILEVIKRQSLGTMRPATAFLSYRREDAEQVKYLQQHLKARGVRAWRDITDLPLGGSNEYEIVQAIKQESDAFVIYITPECLQSDFIWDIEVRAALQRWEQDQAFNIIPILQGVTFAQIQQNCTARGFRSLTQFNAVPLLDPNHGKEQFNKELRKIAERILRATYTLRLRRVGADRNYEPYINFHTFDYEPSSSSLDLDLDWTEIFKNKDQLLTEEEWKTILFPALHDVKNVLGSKNPSRRIHMFIQGHLPTAFAFGYFFSESSNFTLLIEGSNGTWSTAGSISDLPTLRIIEYNTKSVESDESESFVNVAIVEVAMSRNTASAVAQNLPSLGLFYKHHIRFEPLSGPSNVAVEDAAQARAMARQIGRELRRLCDSEGISHIHLFASLPAALAVMVGHQLNGLCPVTLYQFISAGARYVPVCTLGK